MVHRSRFDDSDQRCDGLSGGHLLRQNSTYQIVPQENMGRLHRGRMSHHNSWWICKSPLCLIRHLLDMSLLSALFQISYFLCQYEFFVCPIESYDTVAWTFRCTPSNLFQLNEYYLPEMLQFVFKMVNLHLNTSSQFFF